MATVEINTFKKRYLALVSLCWSVEHKRLEITETIWTMKYRALCWIKLLPVTHVLVDTWMLTVKPVYKLLNVSDDLKWTTNTHVTHFQGVTNNMYGFGRPFLLLHFFTRPPIFLPVHIRFYLSKWRVDGSLHKAMMKNLSLPIFKYVDDVNKLYNFKHSAGHKCCVYC